MRFRLGGWAVAGALVLSGCGVDDGREHAAPAAPAGGAAATQLAGPELVSVRDTLPPAPPPSTTSLTVLLTHDGEVSDPGLDAAAGALAQRPDIRVVIAVPGAPAGATTMSGFPVTAVEGGGSALVAAATAEAGVEPDLVVVGIRPTAQLGGSEPVASAAAAQGIPALVVEVEDGEVVDLAAAAMQLLEVLELDALLDEPAAVHRLTVPSCRAGSLRGRLDVRAAPEARVVAPSDCLSADRTVPDDERAAVGTGHASLARLP